MTTPNTQPGSEKKPERWMIDKAEKKYPQSAKELFQIMDEDFDRYPLPICFEPREELKELNLRKWRIQEIAIRWARLKKLNHEI